MKTFFCLSFFCLSLLAHAQNAVPVLKVRGTNTITENLNFGSGKTLRIEAGATINATGATITGFGSAGAPAFADITGAAADNTSLAAALALKAPLAAPAFTGTPTFAGRLDILGTGVASGLWYVYDADSSNWVRLIAPSSMGANYTISIPAVTGTMITTGDTGTVTNTMLAGSIALSKLSITGTPDGTKFIRDDGTYQTVSSTRTGVYRTLWLPASAGIPRTTNGCGVGSYESSTNKLNYDTLEFDAATDEHAQWLIKMPDEWDGSTVKAKVSWTATSGSGVTYWEVKAVALTNDDAIDTALGSAATTNDTLTATGDLDETAATGALTISNTPAAGKYVLFQLARDADNGSDTLGTDALVLGLTIQYAESSTEPSAW